MEDGAVSPSVASSPLLRGSALGTWEFDLVTQRVRWSSALERIHGIPVGSFEGTFEAYQRDIHPDDRERVLSQIGRNIERRQGHELFYRIVRPDGDVRWLDARGEFITDASGDVRLNGVCVDVTELILEERRRSYLADVTRALATSLGTGETLAIVARLAVPRVADWCAVDIFVDPQDRGRGLNRVAMAHADPEKVAIGHELVRRYPADVSEPAFVKLVAEREPLLIQRVTPEVLAQRTRDAEHLALAEKLGLWSILAAPIEIRGVVVGVVTFATAESARTMNDEDVACIRELCAAVAVALENERLLREAKEAARTREDVIGIVSHDLRTPLSAIVLGAASLLKREDVDDKTTSTARRILGSAERAARLVKELLDFTQARGDGVPVHRRLMDLDEVVRGVVEEVRAVHPERSIKLSTARLQGQWDGDRLQQVFTNLVTNAVEHSGASAEVRVAFVSDPHDAVVEVHNAGDPIPAELMPRLFEPFARGRGPERESRGLGLGLFIAQQIVRAHGGRIDVASDASSGTTFTVRLPRR